ncbi:cytochrome P450 71D9-like [Salvia divinorum]|uniref:Cytochrome P450 71D9-like n=1 Tax=Salvia divinorum TaxID=28513 RepID=A0ABD1G292_SALDI
MEFSISSTLIALIPFLLFLFMFRKSQSISKSAKSYSHIPGPKPLPLIGNLHLMLRTAFPHHLFRDLAAAHGPLLHLQLGELHFLVISTVEFAKQVMRTHDAIFANRPPMLAMDELAYNSTGVGPSPYGAYWRDLRKICSEELLNHRRVQSFRRVRDEESTDMCRWIASRQGSPVDLSERLYLSSYDVTTRASVDARTEERRMMISIISECVKLASGLMMADLYPSVKLMPLITGARFKNRRMHRKLDRVLNNIIEQNRAANASIGGATKVEGFLDILLKYEKDGTLTINQIKAVLVDMFVAGTDTSATTVEWAMSQMIRNPSTLNKAQEEVRRVFDDKGYIDEEKFDELKYLKLIIKETLRLHPALPLLVPRMSFQRCEINGYEIPAGTHVMVNGWALGRDPEYWSDAEKFIPERFEKSDHDFNGSNLEYIPFGAGRRICAGMLFGLANVELFLAMLLYHFDWKMPNGTRHDELDMTESFGATVGRKQHLRLVPIVKRPLPARA